MGELRLYAIGVDEVRDVFGASAEVAAAVRSAAAAAFPPRTTADAPGLLGKLGPLFRRAPGAVVIAPDDPLPGDVDDLVAGRYVRPERQVAAWKLLEAYVAAAAWSAHHIALDGQQFNDLEFDLARAGLPARYAPGRLINNELSLPLQAYRGLSTGCTRHADALAAAAAWRAALAYLSSENRQIAEPYAGWLAQFHHYAQAAPQQGRPLPDVVAIYRAAVSPAGP